jgi:hypothetical protein
LITFSAPAHKEVQHSRVDDRIDDPLEALEKEKQAVLRYQEKMKVIQEAEILLAEAESRGIVREGQEGMGLLQLRNELVELELSQYDLHDETGQHLWEVGKAREDLLGDDEYAG